MVGDRNGPNGHWAPEFLWDKDDQDTASQHLELGIPLSNDVSASIGYDPVGTEDWELDPPKVDRPRPCEDIVTVDMRWPFQALRDRRPYRVSYCASRRESTHS
jgi:hypothetical protein